jgi:hypothetical protein
MHARLSAGSKPSAAEEVKDAGKEKADHLKVMLEFIQPHINRLLPSIQRQIQNKVPTITFDALWYLLRPGTLAYCEFDNEWIGCVIMRVKGKSDPDVYSHRIVKWNILVWFLDYAGELVRAFTQSKPETKHVIHHFEGERDITSLKVIPRVYWDAIDGGARREQFEARGLKKVQLLKSGYKQMNYEGASLDKKGRTVCVANYRAYHAVRVLIAR